MFGCVLSVLLDPLVGDTIKAKAVDPWDVP